MTNELNFCRLALNLWGSLWIQTQHPPALSPEMCSPKLCCLLVRKAEQWDCKADCSRSHFSHLLQFPQALGNHDCQLCNNYISRNKIIEPSHHSHRLRWWRQTRSVTTGHHQADLGLHSCGVHEMNDLWLSDAYLVINVKKPSHSAYCFSYTTNVFSYSRK